MKNCECTCGCTAAATLRDQGVAVCSDCALCCADDADIVCGLMTDRFARCHRCGDALLWGPIQTGRHAGDGAHVIAHCGCGPWRCNENGGHWDHYTTPRLGACGRPTYHGTPCGVGDAHCEDCAERACR